MLIAVVLGSALAIVHVVDWQLLDDALSEQKHLGRDIVTIASADRSNTAFRLDAASCERLGETRGVQRAGVVMDFGTDAVLQLGPRVPVVMVSRTLISFNMDQVVIGTTLAASFAVGNEGERRIFRTTRFGSLAGAVGEPQPAGIDLDSSIAVPRQSSERYALTCVLELDNLADSAVASPALVAQISSINGQPAAYRSSTSAVDPRRSFGNRLTRWSDLLVGVLGAAFGTAARRLRASEISAYRLSGTSALDYWRISMTETIIAAGGLASIGSASAALLGSTSMRLAAVCASLMQSALCWVCVSGVLNLPNVFANPTRLAKDR